MSNICVLGLGYVGLPLIINAAVKGVFLDGFDIDSEKIKSLKNGDCYIKDYSKVFSKLDLTHHSFSDDPNTLHNYSEIIICVPTPVSESLSPDHSFVDSVINQLIEIGHLPSLVVLESTVSPGYTRKNVVEKLENAFGKLCGTDFHVCFSPEREDPGNKEYTNIKIPKVLGGFSHACFNKCLTSYSAIFESVVRASSLETAELTKLHENTFRAVNIAYVNQLRDLAVNLEINLKEVIDLASSKPFGFTRFEPSNGVGGHCIPVDPYFLLDKFEGDNIVKDSMNYIASIPKKTFEWIDSIASVDDSFVIVGLGYKDGVDDLRNSPNMDLIKLLSEKYKVFYYDPNISASVVNGINPIILEDIISGGHKVLINSASGERLITAHGVKQYYDTRYRQKINCY